MWGVAGDDTVSVDLDVFEQLAAISTIRGVDSTGVLQGKWTYSGNRDTWFIEKTNAEVNRFLSFHKWNTAGNKLLFNIFDNLHAGHVRWATKGEVTVENSHPFDCKTLIGMHNGTLKEAKYQDKVLTDSELLFKDIDQNGMVPVLSSLAHDSAYAIVSVEKKTGEISFTRNIHRSLHTAFSTERDVLYWHSEEKALEWILHRNKIKHDGVKSVTAGKIYKIKPWEIDHKNVGFAEVLDLPVKKGVGKPPVGFTQDEWDDYCTDYPDWSYVGANVAGTYGGLYDQSPWVSADNVSTAEPAVVKDAEKEKEEVKKLVELTWPPKGKKKEPVVLLSDFKKNKIEPTAGADNGKPNPLAPGKFIYGKSKKIPYNHCISCGQELNLVQQHFAEKVEVDGVTVFDCTECVATQERMKEMTNYSHVTVN